VQQGTLTLFFLVGYKGVGGGEGARSFLRPFWQQKVYPAALEENADNPNIKLVQAYQYYIKR
jgi:hypothetical protein